MVRFHLQFVPRLALIVGVLLVAFAALPVVDLRSLRRAVMQEQQAKVRAMVEGVLKLIPATDR